ncbi:peptidase M23 [Pseudanabaena sp. ABRG5-3]|nr:peptidase M23 [Pseudanabaena sp. ABRG5-3]
MNLRLFSLTLGGLVSSLAIAAPIAHANRLETFVYDLTDSKIEFSLKNDIEPKGSVISNPTRIVIDLPGIVYQGPTVRRRVGRGVQAVRVGQVDANTTRMVVEFSPDVTINPQQLKLKSRQPGKWSMQLPQNIAAIDLNSVSNFTLPITGAVISSGFGWRVHPVTGEKRLHKGVDFAAPTGTPIFAAADGVVTDAGWTDGGYGNIVELRHEDGSVTLYAHTNRVYVSKGQVVNKGQAIAEVGTTGRSTGPHLHFEVQPDGKNAVDPMDYLQMRQVTLDLASNSFKD